MNNQEVQEQNNLLAIIHSRNLELLQLRQTIDILKQELLKSKKPIKKINVGKSKLPDSNN